MKKLLILIIKFYRRFLSPLKKAFYHILSPELGENIGCRFYPTCSQYAIEAIEKYGVFKGSFMALRRILRCNPFNNGGYDPVK
ncbi:membrane protein insertion efficiency factor YidD [Clostridium sp. SYSU_GA19001]|uniref:membrane protein insertion efficiency factor YidD n=1 Tax=Clostridium caldaquaticum TaxID=2940653 RepID=UPI0020771048|nr:membrane protein insertion efficiency factor YidD [Clostridium caldaquaticum]MCM8711927.1 membrane protein insertion efficiency factor YidD [Clostridium caldaquaticum]